MTLRPRSKVIGNVGQSPITSSKKKKKDRKREREIQHTQKKWAQKKWRQLFGFFSHLFRLSRSDNSAEKWRRHFSAKSHPSLPLATPPSRSHRKQVHGYANEVRAVFSFLFFQVHASFTCCRKNSQGCHSKSGKNPTGMWDPPLK